MFKAEFGLRGRVLAIALVPSLALLSGGVGAAAYLIGQGVHAKRWANEISEGTAQGGDFTRAVLDEWEYSVLFVAGERQVANALATARQAVDTSLAANTKTGGAIVAIDPAAAAQEATVSVPLFMRMPVVRKQVDTGAISARDTYDFYSQLNGLSPAGLDVIARTAPDAGTSVEEAKAHQVFDLLEGIANVNALAAPALTHGWAQAADYVAFAHQVGFSRAAAARLPNVLTGDNATLLHTMTTSPSWLRLTGVQDNLLRRGAVIGDLPGVDVRVWISDVNAVYDQIIQLFRAQQLHAVAIAAVAADNTSRNSSLGGAGVLVLSVGAFAVSLWLSDRLIRRLKRLRRDTLELADDRLPVIMDRIRAGETVDLNTEVAPLDYGEDEIGEVSAAFNRAQLAAVSAAVTEAKTREGVRAVFLNIAHRSQVVVHRQLELLDNVEYRTDDPDRLNMLFQLDHLATRERRNAENLIILGGERPGRRWRSPVRLLDLVRSSIAETEDYAKVRLGRLPEVLVVGSVVADLIHLLAELIDNATSFSPPQSRVEVTARPAAGGVAVEIVDQGLGIAEAELRRFNETLRNPPDFSIDTLSSDSRLGLFVVAALAARHEISVGLHESDYGGVRAAVLIPAHLTVAPETAALARAAIDSGSSTGSESSASEPETIQFAGIRLVPDIPAAGETDGAGSALPALPRRNRSTEPGTNGQPPEPPS